MQCLFFMCLTCTNGPFLIYFLGDGFGFSKKGIPSEKAVLLLSSGTIALDTRNRSDPFLMSLRP